MAKKKPAEMDAVGLRMALNGTSRYFYYDEGVRKTCEGQFTYLSHDLKLLRFARGTVGVVSDCYILYAIAVLGSSTIETICAFLRVLQKREKELSIPDMSVHESAKRRLDTLISCGFVYRTGYTSMNTVTSTELRESRVVMYSITDEGVNILNQRLSKRIVLNHWFQAKPVCEQIGWTSASYTSVVVADRAGDHFRDIRQGFFRTKSIGTVMLPPVLVMELKKKEALGHIAFVPAFLHKNAAVQRDTDFEASCYVFSNTVSQYLYYCDLNKRIGRVVVVVENNDDLVNAAYWLKKGGALKDNEDRIFFTGECAIRCSRSLRDRFLMVLCDDEAEGGFLIVPASPDFVWLSSQRQ